MTKRTFLSLRTFYRLADFRPFQIMHRHNRQAHILGIGPQGTMLGWWIGSTDITEFDPEATEWTQLTKFL